MQLEVGIKPKKFDNKVSNGKKKLQQDTCNRKMLRNGSGRGQ